MKKIISIIVLLSVLYLLGHYIYVNQDDFKILIQISPLMCISIALLYVVFFVVNGLFLKIIIFDFGIKLHFLEYLSLSIATTFGNTFLPFRGGAGLRAIYLKTHHKLNYSLFVASLAGNYIVVFAVNSFVALLSMFVLCQTQGYYDAIIMSVFLSILLVCLIVIVFAPKSAKFVPVVFVRKRLDAILDGWQVIRTSRNILLLFSLSFVNLLIIGIITYFEFSALNILDESGVSITFLQALFFAVTSTLSLFVSITPASLGVREGLVMLVSEIVNVSGSNALAVSVLDRIINFSAILILAPFAFYYLRSMMVLKVKTNV